jgi:hypothetical protein
MTKPVLTEELIKMDLETLSHGGTEGIMIFMEMSRRLREEGKKDAMQDWITIAAPALPEKERNEVLVMLMDSYLLLSSQTQPQARSAAFLH